MADLPKTTDTPPDHQVVALTIEPALLPDWYDEVSKVAAQFCRRMMTVENPEGWFVRIEVHKDKVAEFASTLTERWEAFVAERKAAGNWDAPEPDA
jgi:hypothetical protein